MILSQRGAKGKTIEDGACWSWSEGFSTTIEATWGTYFEGEWGARQLGMVQVDNDIGVSSVLFTHIEDLIWTHGVCDWGWPR